MEFIAIALLSFPCEIGDGRCLNHVMSSGPTRRSGKNRQERTFFSCNHTSGRAIFLSDFYNIFLKAQCQEILQARQTRSLKNPSPNKTPRMHRRWLSKICQSKVVSCHFHQQFWKLITLNSGTTGIGLSVKDEKKKKKKKSRQADADLVGNVVDSQGRWSTQCSWGAYIDIDYVLNKQSPRRRRKRRKGGPQTRQLPTIRW